MCYAFFNYICENRIVASVTLSGRQTDDSIVAASRLSGHYTSTRPSGGKGHV